MTAFGTLGTSRASKVLLKEEPTWAGVITTATAVWPRRSDALFQKVKQYVTSEHAAGEDIGFVKPATRYVTGRLQAELDTATLPWYLKWYLGSLTNTTLGGTLGYKHSGKFALTGVKSFRAFVDEGGLSTPAYRDYKGLVPQRLLLELQRTRPAMITAEAIGKIDASGNNPGAASYPDALIIPTFNGFTVYTGAAGATTLAAMSAWTDPNGMSVEIQHDLEFQDNYISDGTGQLAGIALGIPKVAVGLQTILTPNHKLAAFDADTEISVGIKLDTGKLIDASGNTNHRVEFIFPRCTIDSYPITIRGTGAIRPNVGIKPMVDDTATYSMLIDVYNDKQASDYADAT